MPDDYGDIIAAAAPPKPRKVIRGVEKLQGVQPDLVNHWNNLQTEFDKAGLSPAIKSGFRTAQQQNALHRRGYPTKGNDGFINISPHQEGRALDISFSGAQKPKGREIISAYAKQHGLHVPDDEPWHLALPKQQQGQSNDDYADVVKAATGQADDSYDDIISAAIPTKRQVVPRQGIGADVSVGGGLQRRGSKIQQDAARQQTQQALALPQRGTVPDVGGLITEAARSPEAQRRGEIKQDVLAERKRQREGVSHQYGPSVGTPIGIHAVAKQAERVTHPIQTIRDLLTPEEDLVQEEVERRRSAEQRAVTPEMQAIRKEYGAMSTPARTVAQPLARAGAGILKTGGGIADLVSFTGLPTEKVRDWLNTRGNIVEEGASLAPLTATGAEVAKGIPEKVGQAVTDLGLTVAQLMAMQKASGLSMSKLMGAEALLKTSDMPAAERAAHVTEATAMGKILEGHLSRSASAGLFGLPTGTQSATAVLEGKMSPEDALIQTGVAAGSGALLGGKKAETVPEHPSTMQAQFDQRGFALVPHGSQKPSLPRGARAERTADGVVYFDPKRTDAATIRATPTADLLGHVEPKGPTTTETVVARDADGKEVHSSAVSPENVAAQAELTQRNFPDAKVETGGPELAEQVIADRVTPQRYQHLQFGEVEVLPDQSGASTGRVKVAEVGDPTKIHYVKKADLQGRGNSRMIPVPAEAPAEAPTEAPPTEGTAAAPVPSSPESTIPFADKMLPPEQRVELSPLEKELHDRLAKEFKGRRAAEREAEIDPLTRLGNRRAFDKAQETAPPDAFYIAVDGANLKAKNDAHGHPAGDEYIKNIANHLRETYGQAFRSGAKSDEFNAIDTVSKTPEEAQARFDQAVRDFDAKYGEDVGGKRTGIDGGIGKTAAEADAAGTAAKALSKQKGEPPEPAQGMVRLYRADSADATEPMGKGWANNPEYVSRKYGKGESETGESVWYIDVPKSALDAEYGDWRSVGTTDSDALRAAGITVEPKLYRRSQPVEQRGGTPDASVTPTEAIEPTQVLSKGEGAGAAVPEPASVTEHELIRLGTRGAREMSGEQRLADMIENEVSPRDVAKEFVDKTYWDAGADAQQRFQKAVMRLTGFKVGDVIGRDAQGNDIVAKDWMDLVKTLDLPKDAKGLEGPERGLVVLMDEANKAARGGAETQEAPRTRQLESAKPVFGSTNKGVTLERADILRARLKTKFDPNTLHDITDIATALPDLVELGAFYVEGGSRQFAQWSKKFLNEFDDKDRKKIEPRLREIYEQSVKTVDGPTSSIRNASTEELRRTLDLSTVEPAERKSFQQSIDNALEKGLDKQAESIANNIISGKTESLSNEEAAGVLHRMRELENRYEELHAANKSDPELAKIEATLDRLTQATKQAGTATARDLNFRKATIDQDFKLISMIRQAKEAKGRDLTEAERTRYESIVKERDTAIRERDTAIEQLSSKRLQAELDRASRQRSRAQTRESLDKEAAVIRSNIAAEFARLKGKFTSTQSMAGLGNLDPEGIITRELLKYARNRAKATVGLKAEALIDDAHELVKDFGVSRRQIAEVLSGYGRVPIDRRGEAAKRLADIRSEITRLLKEEDIAAGRISGKQEGPKRDFVRNANRLKVLQKAEAEWERKFNERDFDPKPKHPYPYNSDVRRAEDRVKIAEAKFRREMERARPGHQFRNLSGIWKAWLLSGPPTQAMNIAGTGTYQAFREVARLPAAIADAAWSGVRQAAGLPAQRSIQGPSPSAMLESVIDGMGRRGLPEFMETMRHGAPRSQLERHQFQEIDFGTNSRAVELIEKAHNAIFRFMSASDRVFWQGAYRRNLIDRANIQAKNEGVSDPKARARELIDNPPADLKADAEHDAFVSTFNNDNVLSDKIKRARSTVINKRSLMGKKAAQRLNAAENFALDLVLPFDRTPTNVIARIMEASPLGYGKNAAQLISAAMRKSMPVEHQRQMAQTFGNATAGTALMALGWYLADKAKGVIEVDGQDVYLKIPKLPRINLRTASPAGNILAAGARMRSIHEDPKSSKADYVKTALREPANQPVLRATSTVAELAQDPDRSAGKFFGRLAGSAIPFSGAGRFVGQALDPADKRYPDNSFKEQFKKNIPVARETLPASRVRLLGSTVTKATKEAERLKIAIKGATRQPDETDADFKKRQAIQNGNIRTQIENVVALPEYDAASDADKTKWLKQAASFASARTREQLPEKKEQPEERQFPMPQSGVGFDAAYPADALSKYERMNSTQRAAVRDSMTRKAAVLLRDHRLSDEQKAEYKQRLDALGISAAPRPRRSLREQFAAQ